MASSDFTAADGTPWATYDPNWVDMSTLNTVSNGEIQNNVLQPINSGDELGGYYSTSSSDYSEVDILAGAYANQTRFVSVRGTGGGLFGYGATFTGLTGDNFSIIAIYAGTTGSPTWVANIATGLAVSRLLLHKLALKATGTGTVDFEVWLDGTSIGTAQITGSVIDTGHPGFWSKWVLQAANQWDNWSDTPAATAGIVITDTPHRKVFQQSAEQATVPISGTVDIDKSVDGRIMDGAVEVVPWAVIDAAPTGGAFSGSLVVPTGGQYNWEIRYSDLSETAIGVNQWAVGDKVPVPSQSNGVRWFTTGTTPAADPDVSFFDSTWSAPGASQEGATVFGNKWVADTGRPIGLINMGVGGSALRQEADNGSGYWLATGDVGGAGTLYTDVFEAKLTASGGTAVAGIVYIQGERDALSTLVSELEYATSLAALFALMRSFVGDPAVPIGVSYLGRSTDPAATDVDFQAIRNAQKTVIAADANCNHASTIDIALADTIHYADYTEHATRCAQSLLALTGDVLYYAGPTITGATVVSSTEVDITFSHDTGNNLSPNNGATGVEAFDDGVPVTISGVGRLDSMTYRVTLLSAIVGVITLRYQYGVLPDVTNPIYDNTALGLPAVWDENISFAGPVTDLGWIKNIANQVIQ